MSVSSWDALARVEKRELKLDTAEERSSRLQSVRLRLAEAKEARSAADARKAELDAREQALAAREQALAAREAGVRESVDSTQTPPAGGRRAEGARRPGEGSPPRS